MAVQKGSGNEAESGRRNDPIAGRKAEESSLADTPDIHGNHENVGLVDELARAERDRVDGYTQLASVNGGELNRSIIGNEARLREGSGRNSGNERRARRAARDFTDQLLMQEMARLDLQIAELDRRIDHLGDYITRGEVEVGKDGKLTDEDAEKALREYEERTGRKIDRNDAQAVLDALHNQHLFLMQQRDQYQAERDRLEKAQERLETAATPEQREATIRELDLPDASSTIARSDSKIVTQEGHEALGETQANSQEHMASESFDSQDDLSFMVGGPPTVSAATDVDGATPVNGGEGVQIAFVRAVAGEAVPPGVSAAEMSSDAELPPALEDGQSDQEFTPA